MSQACPSLTLNNAVKIPAIGLGVFQSKPDETTEAVVAALSCGYRHIDTAAAYFNEREVGEGIRRSDVDRSKIFIETKLWISDYGYESALRAFDTSLKKLGIEQLDLWLLHQPLGSEFDKTIQAYKAAEKLLAEGKVRAIGVSNFTAEKLELLMDKTEIVPAVNQIQVHPYYTQASLRATNEKYGIQTQCWSPIGGAYTYRGATTNPLEDPVIKALATKYGKTSAQVVLRWHLDHGFSAIPKSVKRNRIAENFDVFDFKLTPAEVAAIPRCQDS
ncbi:MULTISPECIES: aldo/keto reductase, partial [Pseudomonas]|uniref:aldo/keto reductase n=1 Tax=Pseudomonas TaxID=286 RepID=UPI001BE6E7B7